jgi:hypothetical protein
VPQTSRPGLLYTRQVIHSFNDNLFGRIHCGSQIQHASSMGTIVIRSLTSVAPIFHHATSNRNGQIRSDGDLPCVMRESSSTGLKTEKHQCDYTTNSLCHNVEFPRVHGLHKEGVSFFSPESRKEFVQSAAKKVDSTSALKPRQAASMIHSLR